MCVPPEACDAKVMAKLGEHPNIISFFGYARSYPDTVIVTALALKGSLYDYLHVNKPRMGKAGCLCNGVHAQAGTVSPRPQVQQHSLHWRHGSPSVRLGTARTLEATTVASKVSGTYRWMATEVA